MANLTKSPLRRRLSFFSFVTVSGWMGRGSGGGICPVLATSQRTEGRKVEGGGEDGERRALVMYVLPAVIE